METELLTLQRNNDIHLLQKYVKNLDVDFVCSEINKICMSENGAVVLQALFGGLTSSASCQEKRIKAEFYLALIILVSKQVLESMEKKLMSPKLAEKLLSIIATQMESFSTVDVICLIDTCLQMMRESKGSDGSNCWKYFIPKLLNKIEEEVCIYHNGTTKKGSDYKSEIVIAICIHEWPDDILTNIASMFVDITLTPEEHLKVVNKLCSRIPNINLQEIPPLVHQMLQLTKELHFMSLFLTLAEVFDNKLYMGVNKENIFLTGYDLEDVQAVEATVLYHIYSVVSCMGPQSVKDFIKTLKDCINSPSFILSPFCLTFLLTVSCVSHIFEEEILSILRAAILRNYSEEEKINRSAWIETCVPSAVSIEKLFDTIIENWSRERDKILKGLINLGFTLLAMPKTRGKETQCEKMWMLGNSILVRLINKYAAVTSSVLLTLVNQISQVHETTKYTDCLFHIVRKNPLNVLDCSTVLIQLLDNICTRLPGNVGKRIVAVILPLTKMSQSLRDNLIIVLRKSLFPLDGACREMAVYGILELLKDLKISNLRNLSQSISQSYCGLTQIYSETYTEPGPSHSNEGLCLELLSILKEVFKHQHEIKTVFYRGIYESVYANPELGCHVLDNLQNQFDKFFKPGNDIPPLHFDKTVILQGTTPILQEPLAQLVLSIGLIVAKIEEGNAKCSKLREMFDSLCQRMSDCDVPHFILGKELFDGSPESAVKEEEIRQILGVYEALMGYILSTWTRDSVKHGQMLSSLFRGYCRLSDYVRSLGKPDKKKTDEKTKNNRSEDVSDKRKDKNKIFTFKFPTTVFNFKCASRLLSVLLEDSITWASEQSAAVIKNKRELHRYCMNVILKLLNEAQSFSGTELSKNSSALGYVTKIGRILFIKCVKRLGEMKAFDLQSTITSLECFYELIHLVLVHFRKKFPSFLRDIGGDTCEKGLAIQLETITNEVLDAFISLVDDEMEEAAKEEEVQIRKLSLLLITIATTLANEIPRGAEAQKVLDKIKQICKEKKLKNPNGAKSVLSLLTNVYIKCKPSGSLLLDLTLCLCENLTLIDDEMKIDEHNTYAVINEHTGNACILSVCDTLRDLVNEVEWIVTRLKAELLIFSASSKNVANLMQEGFLEKERELCRHINFCMKVLSMLSAIAIPPGIYADAVLREMGNFYNKVTMVTKYFILKVARYQQELQSTKFDRTVKMIDHELSKNMYCFTEHVIADGTTSIEDKPSKQLKRDPTFLKNKCLRETKIIPKVIYEKEQFQKFVLQLSNKAKINLAGQTKHALARDYRLYAKQVKEILDKENIQFEEIETESEATPQTEEMEERWSKKAKLED